MARDIIEIELRAKDGATTTFRAVGRAAADMGRDVDRAGDQAARGMDDAGRSARSLKDRFDGIGTAAGALVGGMALLGRNALDREREIDGLQRAYGDAADQIIDATEAIQDHTNFSNDAARQAAILGASLVQNYQLGTDQIEELLRVSADLATIHGIDLADAMMRTTSAIRGEAESAELLGLNLSDTALAALAAERGIDGWRTTMTEAEKAAFRYTILMEQAAFSTGAAADAASGAAGRGRDMIHWLDDTAEAAGAALGPAGEFLGVLGNLGLALPLVGNVAGRAVQGIGQFGESARVASLATGALGLAMSPLGIVAGAAAATVGVVLLADALGDDYIAAAEAATARSNDLATALKEMVVAGAPSEQIAGSERLLDTLDAITGGLLTVEEAWARADRIFASGSLTNPTLYEQAERDVRAFEEQFGASFEHIGEVVDEFGQDVAAAATYTGENAAVVRDAVLDVLRAVESGEITLAEGARRVGAITDSMASFGAVLPGVKEDIDAVTAAINPWREFPTIFGAAANAVADLERGAEFGEALAHTFAVVAGWAEDATTQVARMGDEVTRLDFAAGLAGAFAGTDATAALVAVRQGWRDAGLAAVDYLFVQERILATLDAMQFDEGGGGRALNLAQGINETATALDNLTRITLTNTDAWVGQIAAVGDAATALTGLAIEGDEWVRSFARADALVSNGRISLEEYNAAQQATVDILRDRERAEDAVGAIQIKQLPLLAEQTDALQEYLFGLAQLPAAEAQRALALADTAYQTQIANLAALEYRVALGEIPAELATDIIADSARADPILRDILLQYGIVEEGANGEIVVAFDNGPTLVDTISTLDESIDNLTDAINALAGTPVDIQTTQATRDTIANLERLWNLANGPNRPAQLQLPAGMVAGDASGGPAPGTGAPANQPPPSQDLLLPPPRMIAGESLVITPIVDPSRAVAAIHVIEGDLDDLTSASWVASILGDAGGAVRTVAGAERVLAALTGRRWVADLFADARDLQSEAAGAERRLRDVAGGHYEAALLANPADALGNTGLVARALRDLDGDQATVYALGRVGDATGGIQAVHHALNGLNGRSATVYASADTWNAENALNYVARPRVAYVEVRTVAGPGGSLLPYAGGGVVPREADYVPPAIPRALNGRTVLVGEAGAELVDLPVGSRVTPHGASMSRMRGMGGGQTLVNYGAIHLHPPDSNVHGAIATRLRGGRS